MRGQESPLMNKKGFKLRHYSKLREDNRVTISRINRKGLGKKTNKKNYVLILETKII
jgi:hypothetical protein